MHVFFVCDVSKCNEENDLGSAILYFHPPEIALCELYTLCSQIIGLVQFLQATFKSPLVLKLKTRSYSLVQMQSYLLVLGSRKASSLLLKDQLRLICSIFSFYYCGFSHMLEGSGNDWDVFLLRIRAAWDYCLHITRNLLTYGFSAPVVKRVSSDLHLKSNHLLDACENGFNVLGGSLISKHALLLSDAIRDFASYLVLLLDSEHLFGSDVLVTYPLPSDVTLKYVYLNSHRDDESGKLISRKGDKYIWTRLNRFGYPARTTLKQIRSSKLQSENLTSSDSGLDPNSFMTNRLSLHLWSTSAQKGFNLRPVHVICHYHSSTHFMLSSAPEKCEDQVITTSSSCDFEFQCFLCEKSQCCRVYNHHSHSRINDVPYLGQDLFDSRIGSQHSTTSTKRFANFYPYDILSRRSLSHTFHNSGLNFRSNKQLDGGRDDENSDSFEFALPEQVEAILYIHRFQEALLFLLMENHPSEEEIHFMWSCSFSSLMSLQFQTFRKAGKLHHPRTKNVFAIYHPNSGIFFGNNMINAEHHMIHRDFLSHESFNSIYAGRYDKSVYGCSTKHFQMFYERKDIANQKASWIMQLYNKAHHRAKRYLNI